MKRTIKYNLIITLLQFIIFAAILFIAFFIKFNINKKSNGQDKHSFILEQRISNLITNQNGRNVINEIIAIER